MVHRFFVSPDQVSEHEAAIYGDDARQLAKILRVRQGQQVIILDGIGNEYLVELSEISQSKVSGRIISKVGAEGEPNLRVSLVQGMPKGDKLEYIIQKCTELGACGIFPVTADRSVVQLDVKRAADRLTRWRRIAKEAAEQSARGMVPEVGALVSWKDKLSELSDKGYRMYVPYELEKGRGFVAEIKRDLARFMDHIPPIAICIGPEGGLEPSEVDLAISLGAVPVSLGRRILRTETAGVVALSCAMAASGDLP